MWVCSQVWKAGSLMPAAFVPVLESEEVVEAGGSEAVVDGFMVDAERTNVGLSLIHI